MDQSKVPFKILVAALPLTSRLVVLAYGEQHTEKSEVTSPTQFAGETFLSEQHY